MAYLFLRTNEEEEHKKYTHTQIEQPSRFPDIDFKDEIENTAT